MSPRDEIEAIQQLKFRYFRCLDTKDWEGMSALLVPEATSAYGDGKYSYEGREDIMKFLTDSLGRDTIMTAHFGHHPEIALESDDRATGVWSFEDTVIDTQFEITIRGAGFYSDVYVKRDGAWRILSTGYRRTFEEMESRKDRPGLRLTASRFAPLPSD